jgi:serine/threonine protein kinase
MPPTCVLPRYGSSVEAAAFIAKYDWVEVVGAGSYSSVHRAFEKRTGRPVAIKVIKKEILSPDVEAQIINEAVRHAGGLCVGL